MADSISLPVGIHKAYSLEEAENFFDHFDSGSIICVDRRNNKERLCSTKESADKFYKTK